MSVIFQVRASFSRLNFFVDAADRDAVTNELHGKLTQFREARRVFQVKEQTIDGIKEAASKGSERRPQHYYTFVNQLSRIAVAMFSEEAPAEDVDVIVWQWSHNLFNLLRGYPVPVLEFQPGAVRGFRNI